MGVTYTWLRWLTNSHTYILYDTHYLPLPLPIPVPVLIIPVPVLIIPVPEAANDNASMNKPLRILLSECVGDIYIYISIYTIHTTTSLLHKRSRNCCCCRCCCFNHIVNKGAHAGNNNNNGAFSLSQLHKKRSKPFHFHFHTIRDLTLLSILSFLTLLSLFAHFFLTLFSQHKSPNHSRTAPIECFNSRYYAPTHAITPQFPYTKAVDQ